MDDTESLSQNAYRVAFSHCHDQYRRDGHTPYIEHVDAVMARSAKDEVSQAIAAMHDLVEDGHVTLDQLRVDDFPEEVIKGVDALSRRAGESYPAFIERVRDTENGRYIPIKIADILSNLSDNPSPAQIRRYARALLTLLP